ncbi:hypothetical protein [Salmonella sp. s54412]|uniref:hypothetical protein n=1 Tax=unclassified Salmonella TaxID=2614656 RepID=UPI0037546AB9
MAQVEAREVRENLVRSVRLVHEVRREAKENAEAMVHLDYLVRRVKVENEVNRVHKVAQEYREAWAFQDTVEEMALEEIRDWLAIKDQKEEMESRVKQDHRVSPV